MRIDDLDPTVDDERAGSNARRLGTHHGSTAALVQLADEIGGPFARHRPRGISRIETDNDRHQCLT